VDEIDRLAVVDALRRALALSGAHAIWHWSVYRHHWDHDILDVLIRPECDLT
jgi:hypothetical protein